MFDGFTEHEVSTGRGTVFARVGRGGPPLLLLHGYPQTHLMWHAAAPLLAGRYTVVVADLPPPVADAGSARNASSSRLTSAAWVTHITWGPPSNST